MLCGFRRGSRLWTTGFGLCGAASAQGSTFRHSKPRAGAHQRPDAHEALTIAIAEGALDLFARIGAAVDLDVRIDEVVERRPRLTRLELDVPAGGELNAILGEAAEVVVLLL